MTTLGAIGVLYGVEISASVFGKILLGALYGFVGLCAAVPLAFAGKPNAHLALSC
jgi:uncharacterized membrane protein YuzA (DUF378 family)